MGSEFMNRGNRLEQQVAAYVHNPYAAKYSREEAKRSLPADTLRLDLFGKAEFLAFPDQALDRSRLRNEAPPLEERPNELKQLFFGQLPYKVPDSQILWLVEDVAGCEVLFIERVMQEKSRKGCMQVFVHERDVDKIIRTLDRRILFDKTGVWHATDDEQLEALEGHCTEANRFKGFPFRMMVVERSTSTYVRRRKNTQRSRSATPPPTEASPTEQPAEYLDDEECPAADCGELDVECPPMYYEPYESQPGYCTCPECMQMQMPPAGPYSSFVPAPYYYDYPAYNPYYAPY